ncbi:MAG: hypothetical protein ACRCVD_13755 [Halioglobus sp.]
MSLSAQEWKALAIQRGKQLRVRRDDLIILERRITELEERICTVREISVDATTDDIVVISTPNERYLNKIIAQIYEELTQ